MKKLNAKSFSKFEKLKLENEQTSKIIGGAETCSNKKCTHYTGETDGPDGDTTQTADPEFSDL